MVELNFVLCNTVLRDGDHNDISKCSKSPEHPYPLAMFGGNWKPTDPGRVLEPIKLAYLRKFPLSLGLSRVMMFGVYTQHQLISSWCVILKILAGMLLKFNNRERQRKPESLRKSSAC